MLLQVILDALRLWFLPLGTCMGGKWDEKVLSLLALLVRKYKC